MVGGGDGGVVREVLKNTCVQRVVLCEIDQVKLVRSKVQSITYFNKAVFLFLGCVKQNGLL